jgi:hypothetical protein
VERRGRKVAQQEKKMVAARTQQHALATCIAANNASPWTASTLVYILGVLSPLTSGFYNDNPSATLRCVTPNLSPRYEDTLPHGGFNPNDVFYSPAYEQASQREPGPGADDAPFTGRRGLLEFASAGGEEVDEEEEVEEEEEEEGEEGVDEEDDNDEEDDDDAGATEDADDLVEVDAIGVRKKKRKASGT